MVLSLKESLAATEMAAILYSFLPGSSNEQWKGHVSFQTIAKDVGVGDFWRQGSKQPAIATLLEHTLKHRPNLFEKLILAIVNEGMKYRQKIGNPIRRDEIDRLNEIILRVGFKFPDLWDPAFLDSLGRGAQEPDPGATEATPRADQQVTQARLEFAKRLAAIRDRFFALCSWPDRQAAGLAFERVLNELFELHGLEPREAFRVTGEQIDGSFVLNRQVYLVEAKWEVKPLSEAPLLVFHGKVAGKSVFTRGVFFALNGVTEEARQGFSRGKQPNFFLVDGDDLVHVLEAQIRLDDLLRRKERRLAEEGVIFVSARGLLSSL